MKFIYAFRNSVYYPHRYEDLSPVYLPPKEQRGQYLRKLRSIGFEGLELSSAEVVRLDERGINELAKELSHEGLPCIAIRGRGGMHNPKFGAQNRQILEKTVEVAGRIGAQVVNTTTIGAPSISGMPGFFVGEPVSQGSSRQASEADYEVTAEGLANIADKASNLGVSISIEVHQHSIADNSRSALHLLELIDRRNVGLNPDLGNIYWCYEVPEESCEAAIVALAPHVNYWHCKNLIRVHIPENKHSIFIRSPLPDGDINYRFAISAILDASYEGCLAIEGVPLGDQIATDGRSLEYAKGLIEEIKAAS
ncbi:sugar phosphate isomerase/epimerase family protein [Chloroflexota bacterium]